MRRSLLSDRNNSKVCFWKFFGALGFLFGIGMTFVALLLKKKNDEYMEALIDMSDSMLDDEYTKEEWSNSNSLRNRKTVEEKMSDRRVEEE